MPPQPSTLIASPEGVNRFNAAKKRLNLTFAEIAAQAEVSVDTVRRLWHPERGKRVSKPSIVAIAQVLELEPEEISSEFLSPFAEAAQRIQEAIERGAVELNLSGLGLTTLPTEVGQLSSLKVLYLHNNQLTPIPPELGYVNRFVSKVQIRWESDRHT